MTPEVAANDLVRRVEAGEQIHVLDVRAPFRLESGRIDAVPAEWFHNIPGSQLVTLPDPAAAGIPRDRPVVVVCGRGNDSRFVGAHLNARGFTAASLAGGMRAWMELVVPRALPPPPGSTRLVQLDRIGKGALGYVLVSGGEAVVIDPPRHLGVIRDVLREADARLVAVADTHAHADYVSGGPALAKAAGVPYHLHPADARYPFDGTPARVDFTPAEDGRGIPVGAVTLRVEHTPGHTEGSVCYRAGADVVFTGDFVFVRSMGRPDLGGKAEEWTAALWRSLERARASWPPGLRVLPGHLADAAERNADRTVGRRVHELAAGNVPFAMTDRDRFTSWVLGRTGAFPDAYRRIKAINLGLESPGEEELVGLEAGMNRCALG